MRGGTATSTASAAGRPPRRAGLLTRWLLLVSACLLCLMGGRVLVARLGERWFLSGDLGAVRLALRLGADPNARLWGSLRLTPLHWQAMYGSADAARALIQAGARVDAEGQHPGIATPLWEAVRRDNMPVAQVLIAAGADPRYRSPSSGGTPLHSTRSREMCQLLLDHGAGRAVNMPTVKGVTPLHVAARDADPGAVTLLLDAGADPNARASDGSTPLGWAQFGGRRDNGDVLVARGAREAIAPRPAPGR